MRVSPKESSAAGFRRVVIFNGLTRKGRLRHAPPAFARAARLRTSGAGMVGRRSPMAVLLPLSLTAGNGSWPRADRRTSGRWWDDRNALRAPAEQAYAEVRPGGPGRGAGGADALGDDQPPGAGRPGGVRTGSFDDWAELKRRVGGAERPVAGRPTLSGRAAADAGTGAGSRPSLPGRKPARPSGQSTISTRCIMPWSS